MPALVTDSSLPSDKWQTGILHTGKNLITVLVVKADGQKKSLDLQGIFNITGGNGEIRTLEEALHPLLP